MRTASLGSPSAFWRLSAAYFWYYAALGALMPYFPRWISELGHGAETASAVIALWYLTRVLGPPLWSHWVHASAQPQRWLRGGAWASAASFVGFLWLTELWSVSLCMAVFSFFANVILPQIETLALTELNGDRGRYARARLWGSIGFLLVATGWGPLLDLIGREWLPLSMLPLLLLCAMAVQALPARRPISPQEGGPSLSLRVALQRAGVRRFLAAALLMQLGFGPFYVYFTIHLEAAGHGGTAIGLLWGAGVVAEILMFWFVNQIFGARSALSIMRVCLLLTVLRWSLVASLADSFTWMLLMQLLHALSFAAFHAACMQRVMEFFPGPLALRGQSLLYACLGLGGVLGTLLAGLAWHIGEGQACFLFGAFSTALALASLSWRRPDAIRAG
ncbi:MFS transporter [Pseudomarimonas arenosa]|uniref:MFS transporter n=1 Tax=Pseudomarimonas arenosa TaxID=2774145 RepID=A0AAW3ZKT4_9GAMM|nr:MFS transporter [Pseudomarimonas arenosa]MBD8526743.1 MFS transporter [Pseudomarimonas arenosa]